MKEEKQPRRRISPISIILIAGVAIFLVFALVGRGSGGTPDLDISQVLQKAQAGEVERIVVKGDSLDVITKDGQTFDSRKEESVSIVELLEQRGVEVGAEGVMVEVKSSSNGLLGVFLTLLPIILIGGFIFFMFRRAQGGLGQITRFGRSQARKLTLERPRVTFADVAGVDEAKGELEEIVEFLGNPIKFSVLSLSQKWKLRIGGADRSQRVR